MDSEDIEQIHLSPSAPGTGVRKRPLTESRRRQNRESQRRFRERKKAKQMSPSSVNTTGAGLPPLRDGLTTDGLDPFQTSPLADQEGLLDDPFGSLFDPESIAPEFAITEHRMAEFDLSGGLRSAQGSLERASTTHTSTLPSPYKNYLQIQRLNFYAARIQNALHLGVPLVLAQKNEDTVSPWYWHTQFALLTNSSASHNIASGTNPLSSVGIANPNFIVRPFRRKPCFELSKSVMADLAPTPLQLSSPHDLYLDVIPFPVFRDRVITLLSMTPPAFDEGELKRDIEAEGLLVWGVAQGRRDRASTLVRDRRNWECSRWFFKKWKLLVNGSGLEEQSRWWRQMRGEDESEDEES